jgi:uncharacterized protein YjbI with pentapeptide repeats
MIKLKNLLVVVIVSTLGFATPTQAGNPEDVKRLLETKECTGCDLKNADLSGVNLSLAILVDANLSGANLSGANLSQADLSRANLSGANLSRANLRNAYLTNANLDRTNLLGASLNNTRGLPILALTPARSQDLIRIQSSPSFSVPRQSTRKVPGLVQSAPPPSIRQVPSLGQPLSVTPEPTPTILPRQLPEANIPLPTPTPEVNIPIPAATFQIVLIGIIDIGDISAALFDIDGITTRVNLGEPIGTSGWMLVSVKNDEVIVRRNGEVRSIYTGQTISIPPAKYQSN